MNALQHNAMSADGLLAKQSMNLRPMVVRLADGSSQEIRPIDLPDEFDEMIQSWDMAFKDLKTSDYVVGGVWGSKGANRFLIDQLRGRMGFPETLAAVQVMTRKWPKASAKMIEDKANGSAVISSLRNRIPGYWRLTRRAERSLVRRRSALTSRQAMSTCRTPTLHPGWMTSSRNVRSFRTDGTMTK